MDRGAVSFFSLPFLLPVASTLLLLPTVRPADSPPNGCGPSIPSHYYNLCSLDTVWGVVVEALAVAGVVVSFILLMVLLASLPLVTDGQRRSSVGIQAGFLVSTMGLFGLAFAFIVGADFATCVARHLLFGVFFAGCLACLLMQGVRLNMLVCRDSGPPSWVLCLGALGLWLVEVIINVEWLVLTAPLLPPPKTDSASCFIANQDFAKALIYVLVLLVATLIAAVPALLGRQRHWLRESAFLLATATISLAVWVVWLTMYLYGNTTVGKSSWDEPTLAITLVFNAWVFLILSSIPQIYMLTEDHMAKPSCGESLYSNTEGYETILKDQKAVSVSKPVYENLYIQNKAFSMDEPNPARRPISPNMNSRPTRGRMYQPTELAIITKGLPHASTNMQLSPHRPPL